MVKKSEEQLQNLVRDNLHIKEEIMPESKLRAVEVIASRAASEAGFRIYENMEVPQKSVIAEVY